VKLFHGVRVGTVKLEDIKNFDFDQIQLTEANKGIYARLFDGVSVGAIELKDVTNVSFESVPIIDEYIKYYFKVLGNQSNV
jgi:hypothetical protein